MWFSRFTRLDTHARRDKVPTELEEAFHSIVFAATRTDIAELKEVRPTAKNDGNSRFLHQNSRSPIN